MARLLDLGIYACASIGLLASVCLAVYGIATAPMPLTGPSFQFAKWTMLGLLGVGCLFVLRYNQLTYDRTPRDVEASRYSGCPDWMRTVCYLTMATGIALFLMPAALELAGTAPHAGGAALPCTTPGGFGMLAYSSLFAQLYSANALAKQV